MDIFRIENLHFRYGEGEKEALQGVNLCLQQGKFYILCGKSGSGKSTLLRHMKKSLAPVGELSGNIFYNGRKKTEEGVGFVFQNPDSQIVTDKVWHELAFGLESVGYDEDKMHLRVAEMASYFGIENWFDKKVSELSGGQKQILNLASVMVMDPEVLLLDEPTAWLDPVAAQEFLHTLDRIHRELGVTVLLSEHNLEEAIGYADELIVMEQGKILSHDVPGRAGKMLRETDPDMYSALPVALRISMAVEKQEEYPCTVAQGRVWLEKYLSRGKSGEEKCISRKDREAARQQMALRLKNICFRYEDGKKDVVRDLSLEIQQGEIFAVLGGNGAGKSTMLRLMAGVEKPVAGKLILPEGGKICLLPQDVTALFVGETLREDLRMSEGEEEIRVLAEKLGISEVLDRHPYDLSGGEQQRAALLKVLLHHPDILLLDEPTKGIDAPGRKMLGEYLRELAAGGTTIVMVSHDLEFTGTYADRAGLFFRGKIEAVQGRREFFMGNRFYTTAANRMAGEYFKEAVTAEEVIACIRQEDVNGGREERRESVPKMEQESVRKMKQEVQYPEDGQKTRALLLQNRAGRGRAFFPYLAGIFVVFPVLLWVGEHYLENRKYLLVSMVMVIYGLLPFFTGLERRGCKVQKLVVLSVLTAIAVTGRCAFYMVPNVKPMAAVAIIAGISLGAESGFFVGALSMLVSNMIFGQGPWTPWQMFAMGLVGMFAGVFMANRRFREADRAWQRFWMFLYGFLSVMIFYGGIMNPASLLMMSYEINRENLTAIYLSGIPMDLVHGGTTAVILLFAGVLLLKKMDRVKKKYGIEASGL